MTPALTLHAVAKAYGEQQALAGVDLELEPGRILALLGPNGAGKTTAVGIAAGLIATDTGRVRVCGHDPRADRRAAGRIVGIAPQEIGLYPSLTVRDNLRGFAEVYGLGARAARERAAELLAPFGLEELADRPAGQLSGGEQRRAHAAIALVNRPRLVLLDEPTAGADTETRNGILEVVRTLSAAGTAVLYTTHYLPEVEQLDADVALLERGRVIAAGPLAELIALHATPVLVLAFDGPVPARLRTRAGFTAAPDHVRIAGADPGATLLDVLTELGDERARLARVEIVQPSLESAYLALTGRRTAEAVA